MTKEPEKPAEAEGQAAPQAPPPKAPEDEPTKRHDLHKLAVRLAKQRRRRTVAEISFRRGKGQKVRIPLEKSATVIGRDPRCDVVLADAGVSRQHARVVKTERGFFELVDLSSTNGTLVDGTPVARMTLLDGDAFVIGETRFVLHLREDDDA